ncbi:MAG: tripartite tricarboxylate transporter TctB family protein [Deltaproteobacteria bacterium]|nr:tripartite tricarboxylate transporter TctB family protein [Deltaproteobacteria bacterium]
MREKLKLVEVWFKLVLLILFAFLYLVALPYPEDSKRFPQLIALFSLTMLVISLILDFTRKETVAREITGVAGEELRAPDEGVKKERKKRFGQAWGIILVSVALGFWEGFIFSTLFLFLGFALFFGKRKDFFKNAAIAIATTVIIYFIFESLMGVPLLEK